MKRISKLFLFLGLVLVSVFTLLACSKKYYKVTLKNENLSIVEKDIDLKKVKVNTVLTVKVNIPSDKLFKKLIVNSNDITDLQPDNTYKLTVVKNTEVDVEFTTKPVEKYNVTLGSNLFTSDDLTELLAGAVVNITINIPKGQEIDEFKVDGSKVAVDGNTYKLTVSTNHSVSVTFKPLPTFNVVLGANLSSKDALTGVVKGSIITIEINVPVGNQIDELQVDGKKVEVILNTYKLTVTGNHNVTVTFKADTQNYNVTLGTGLTCASPLTNLQSGTKLTINIAIPADNEIATFKIDGQVITVEPLATIYELTVLGNHNVEVTFRPKTPKFTVTLGAGLSSTDPLTNVLSGTVVKILISIPADHKIKEFKVDDNVVAVTGNVYDLTVTKNHNVTVTFVGIIKTYSVTLGANLSSTDPLTDLLSGAVVNIKIQIPAGKEINEFKVDGVKQSVTGDTYVLTVSKNHTVEVTFREISATKYTVTLGKGLSSKDNLVNVSEGAVVNILININEGFEIEEFKVDEEVKTVTGNTYELTVTKNHNVSVTFLKKTMSLTLPANVTADKPTPLYEDTVKLTINVEAGKTVSYLTLNGEVVPFDKATNTYSFIIRKDTVVKVSIVETTKLHFVFLNYDGTIITEKFANTGDEVLLPNVSEVKVPYKHKFTGFGVTELKNVTKSQTLQAVIEIDETYISKVKHLSRIELTDEAKNDPQLKILVIHEKMTGLEKSDIKNFESNALSGSYVEELYLPLHFSLNNDSGEALCKAPYLRKVVINPDNKEYKAIDDAVYQYQSSGDIILVSIPSAKPYYTFEVLPGTKGIERDVFRFNKGIVNLIIGDSVTNVEDQILEESNIREITIGKNLDTLLIYGNAPSVEAINLDPANPHMKEENGILYDKDFLNILFYPQKKKDKTYTAKATLTHLVINNDYLEKIIIPKDYNGNFNRLLCKSLKEIEVDPKNTKYYVKDWILYEKGATPEEDFISVVPYAAPITELIVNDATFRAIQDIGHKNLEKITYSKDYNNTHFILDTNKFPSLREVAVEEGNAGLVAENGILYDIGKTEILMYPANKRDETYVMPATLTKLPLNNTEPRRAPYVKTLTIGAEFVHENFFTMSFFSNLETIIIPTSIKAYKIVDNNIYSADGKSLYFYFFNHKSTKFVVPENVETIESGAITFNPYLKELDLNKVKNIKSYAISVLENLEKVYIKKTVESIECGAFAEELNKLTIYLEYEKASKPEKYQKDFYMPEAIKAIVWGHTE